MTIYFTSDLHFGHFNILKYCNRPFNSIEEMDETLIKNWNKKVSPSDTIYILGDVFMCDMIKAERILNQLNGQKILIYGNHDKVIKRSEALRNKFVKCVDYLEITVEDPDSKHGKQFIVMSHYAMFVWNKSHHGSIMLHGHSHGTLKYPIDGKILDVGVDIHNYTPISFQEVKVIMTSKKSQFVDYHE